MICRGRCAYGVSRPRTEEGSRSESEQKEKRREEGGEESSEESVNDERDYQGFEAAILRPWKPAEELIGFPVPRKARLGTMVESKNPLFFSQTSIFWVHLWCF